MHGNVCEVQNVCERVKLFCFAKASQDGTQLSTCKEVDRVHRSPAVLEIVWRVLNLIEIKKPCFVLQTSQGGGGVGGVRTLVQTMGTQAFYMLIS